MILSLIWRRLWRRCELCQARCATAALRLDVHVEKLAPVIVGQFFARLDMALGEDEDAATVDDGHAIGLAGVVDVARLVMAWGAIDRAPLADREQIGIARRHGIFWPQDRPHIFSHAIAPRDPRSSKQPKTRSRATNHKLMVARLVSGNAWHLPVTP